MFSLQHLRIKPLAVEPYGSNYHRVQKLTPTLTLLKERKETLFKCLVALTLEHCKLKLTINTNQVKWWFLRRGETGVPGENLSVQRREPTNSTHISRQIWESNPGHIGGRRVLSLLRHPCTAIPVSSKCCWHCRCNVYIPRLNVCCETYLNCFGPFLERPETFRRI